MFSFEMDRVLRLVRHCREAGTYVTESAIQPGRAWPNWQGSKPS